MFLHLNDIKIETSAAACAVTQRHIPEQWKQMGKAELIIVQA
jgi:hypothetical protein